MPVSTGGEPRRRGGPTPLVLSVLLVLAPSILAGATEGVRHPDAVIIALSERDLNRIARDAFRANGGPVFEGWKRRVSRSVSDLHYLARLSDPTVELEEDGAASLRFDIDGVELRIGRIERRIVGRLARCEDAAVTLVRDPLPVDVELRFTVDDAGLRIVPQSVEAPGARKAFRLTRPARCRNTLLPTWLLWWIGKPQLKQKLGRLDELLLERAREGAESLGEGGGLLHEEWQLASAELRLAPRAVQTRGGRLLVSLAGSTGAGATPLRSPLQAPAPVDEGSYLAISESWINAVLEAGFAGLSARPRRPGGNFRRLFESEALFALVPGLRDVEPGEELRVRFRFREPPRVHFDSLSDSLHAEQGAGSAARIEIEIGGIEMELLLGSGLSLGVLSVDRGSIGVVPYANPRGGVSFELLRNQWRLSSNGVEFDEPLLAATIQELVFAELFETRYEPLLQAGLTVGKTHFAPRTFRSVDGYLLVGFDESRRAGLGPRLATRTGSPPGSR